MEDRAEITARELADWLTARIDVADGGARFYLQSPFPEMASKCSRDSLIMRELYRRSLQDEGGGSLTSAGLAGAPSVGKEVLKKAVMRYAGYHERSMAFADDDESPLMFRVCQQRDGLLSAVVSLDAAKIEAALRDTDIVGSSAPSSAGSMVNNLSPDSQPQEAATHPLRSS